jgi:acyl carrier protein
MITEIKQLLIESLNLEDLTAEDIDPDAPLFGEGLGLDSIDALEIAVALQKRYGVVIESSSSDTRKHFRSVRALAEFVSQMRTSA